MREICKDGVWCVLPQDRPKGWESMGLIEPETYTMAAVLGPDLECEASTPEQPRPETREFPVPPEQFFSVFGPIFNGLKAGMEARKQLVELTHYCITLEIAVQEHDARMAGKIQASGDLASRNP